MGFYSRVFSVFLMKESKKRRRLDDAFSEFFKVEASPVEGQSLRQNEKAKMLLKRDASGKKGMLSCCKCLFD